ncbi:hypothetical protein AMS68_004679 [Peltaster fructicola]|uniref:Derlin n=1 Tax=Peltaster fructicola TaxID=286661 RepID=A0A6H0XWL1_9PEZI|nr:hypothetical protein AMS68_004679 [Peltaster fructicola]
MANMLGGGEGGFALPLEAWFYEMPIITRCWTTATVITGILVQCHILTPFQLFYSHRAVFNKGQYWRLLSTFVYFGPLSLNLVFHLFFMQRYARMLEESAVTTAHFSWLMMCAASTILVVAPFFSQAFLGASLSSTLTYIWSRRNPDVRLSFFGVLNFKAPWLPWVLVAFNVVLHGHWPKDELCGIVVGHIFYFLSDIYPGTHDGYRPMNPPQFWLRLFDRRTPAADMVMNNGVLMRREAAVPAIPEL